jgi:hypothetical protein
MVTIVSNNVLCTWKSQITKRINFKCSQYKKNHMWGKAHAN